MGRERSRVSSLIRKAAQDQLSVVHPDYPGVGITISQLFGPSDDPRADIRNAGPVDYGDPSTWIGALDRCPCGTGTCARMAAMYAKGELKLNEPVRNQGVLGVIYTGRLVEETEIAGYKAVIPTISVESWICGYGSLVLDPTDHFGEGFTVGDI